MLGGLRSIFNALGSVRQWHWISAALCLVGLLLFALTGITLNHAADISAKPMVITVETELPSDLLNTWQQQIQSVSSKTAHLPENVRRWLADSQGLILRSGLFGKWQDGEFYLALPKPGGDAWLTIDMESGGVFFESSERGWIAYFNDLHKGRDTGLTWRWFIDVFAVACLVFCCTGLWLLARHATGRSITWPLVGLGVVTPLLLLLLFVH